MVGSDGMRILKYVQSEEFGKYGESIKLIATINVSREVTKMLTLGATLGIHEQAGLRKRQT